MFGIGNCERGDDGVGWVFLDKVKQSKNFYGTMHYRYQLNLEDVLLLYESSCVIFIDATEKSYLAGFKWEEIIGKPDLEITSHQLSPQSLIYLCKELYHHTLEAYLLTISGKQWELGSTISFPTQKHLNHALNFFLCRTN